MSLNELVNQPSSQTFSALDAEEIFLGALIGGSIDPSEISKIRGEMFAHSETKLVYETIIKIYHDSGGLDYLSFLTTFAKSRGTDNAKRYTEGIIAKVPYNFNTATIISIIECNFLRRESVEILQRAQSIITENPYAAPEVTFAAYDKIDSLLKFDAKFSLSEEMRDTADEIVTGGLSKMIVPTGISGIDKVIGGFSTQEITIIGGRPGNGKTTTSVAMTKSILDRNPEIVVVKFELEMSKKMILAKFLSSLSGVSSYGMRINELTEEDKGKIVDAAEAYKKYDGRLYIFDDVYDLPTMNKICRALKAKIAFVDFITLMDGVEEDKRNELGKIAKYAKRFAKANNMSYVFYSQISREVERRESHRPQMSDLAESDQLTQLASEIILLFYKFKYSGDPADKNKMFVILDKARYSSIGEVKLFFDADKIILRV